MSTSADAVVPWLLVLTKPKQEAVAERTLRARGFPAYCPRVLDSPTHARAPLGPIPLFTSYVFCRTRPEDALAAATYCPGVRRLVRFGEAFAALSDADIALLRARESKGGYLVIPPVPVRSGDAVRMTSGPLRGLEAVVDGLVTSSERVRLLLNLAFGAWRAVVPLSDVLVVHR